MLLCRSFAGLFFALALVVYSAQIVSGGTCPFGKDHGRHLLSLLSLSTLSTLQLFTCYSLLLLCLLLSLLSLPSLSLLSFWTIVVI